MDQVILKGEECSKQSEIPWDPNKCWHIWYKSDLAYTSKVRPICWAITKWSHSHRCKSQTNTLIPCNLIKSSSWHNLEVQFFDKNRIWCTIFLKTQKEHLQL